MSFIVRPSTAGAFTAPSSVSQLVNAAQTPIYEPPENITITTLNTTSINTASPLNSELGTNTYQTLGTENIVHPPTNSLTIGGVNTSVLNKRTRTNQAAAEACVSTWTLRNKASNNNWISVCWSPELSLFCAVSSSGSGNRVMTSLDGVNWTSRTSATDNNWNSICWSPELGIFCAVSLSGTGNRVMTSPDGVNWTSRTSAADNDWISVCWSPELGLFCAVAGTGTGDRVMTSPDGINWTSRTSAVDNVWSSVCWSPELGLFCAVSLSLENIDNVMTSLDGVNWTLHTGASIDFWVSVCWSPELSLFCAVSGFGQPQSVMTSLDGINWTLRTTPPGNQYFYVCWSPELSLFCAVGSEVMSSPDGINWTPRTTAANVLWSSVCWSPELSIFCSVAGSEIGQEVMTSAIGMPNSQSVLKTNPSYMTVTQTGNVGISTAAPTERLEVTGNILASGTITPFTGAHITPTLYTSNDIGKVVSSTGHIADISINNAWPRTLLSSTEKDIAIYGVISEIKDGTALVNGVGEGAIWVSNHNGLISNGDLLTSSPLTGYSQKQDDGIVYNYTVARAIMNCAFDEKEIKPVYEYQKFYTYRLEVTDDQESFNSRAFPDSKYYIKLEKNLETGTVTSQVKNVSSVVINTEQSQIDENSFSITFLVEQVDGTKLQTFKLSYSTGEEMFVIYLDVSESWEIKKDETGKTIQVPSYNIKYVDDKGTEITFEDYQKNIDKNQKAYKCALIGCIYLCG